MGRLLLLLCLLGVLWGVAGCGPPAYQRGILADPMMSFDPQDDPTARLEASIHQIGYHEHAISYAGGSGGSSGCPSCK
jgi:hypothetical protein